HASSERFGEEVIVFDDPDGVPLELAEAPLRGSVPETWPGAPVAADMAVQGLHGVTLLAPALERTAELLVSLGLQHEAEAPEADPQGARRRRVRLAAGERGAATHVDLLEVPQAQPGRLGAGSIHHFTLRVR